MHDPLESQWSEAWAEGRSEAELLVYRSRLLGGDLRITNFGGGNTSAKLRETDPLTGGAVDVLWVKGSGGDLGSIDPTGFATLYLDKLHALRNVYRGVDHEDEMVDYLPHCTFACNPRAASIDTPLHAFVPARHVDHVHPDAVTAIAACVDGERQTAQVFGGTLGWLPWQRPGFELGVRLARLCAEQPALRGVVLGGHGLMTWGDTARECYDTTLDAINRAAAFLRTRGDADRVFGEVRDALPENARRTFVRALMPQLRGRLSAREHKVAHFCDTPEVLAFVCAARAADFAALGTSCPDHFLRTKIKPLFVEPGDDPAAALARMDELLASYRDDYAAYYERRRHPDSPAMRDPAPVVVLLAGIGMLTFAKDKPTARQAAEFYVNAINVMRGASAIGEYVGLSEREAFNIEYWALEEAKLRRQPPERRLSRRVALVTGGAGGIGRAVAVRLLDEKACVVLTDIDGERLAGVGGELAAEYGTDFVRWRACDVTDEASVIAAREFCVEEYGGVDVAVCCAGFASVEPFATTSLELWQKNLDVLTTGYFLIAREVFGAMTEQGTGGSIVFIASKNAMAASAGASAYCTAKAAVVHLARCIALEGAPHGIRVNTVNPDAVLRDSRIWEGAWRTERAATYGIADDQLEEHYRKRSLLGREVLPADVAEAVLFFASDLSAKSTGNILNVDAGNANAFVR